MKYSYQDVTTYFLALVARVLTPAFRRQLARLCIHLVADVPQLGTTWVVQFTEPCLPCAPRPNAIDATLHQFGRYVSGNGHIQGEPGDPFDYRGVIARNVFYGTFRRTDAHVVAGTGTFVLKISANSQRMTGHCTWYDSLLDNVWSSEYVWSRKT